MKRTLLSVGLSIAVVIAAAYQPTFQTSSRCLSSPSAGGSCGPNLLNENTRPSNTINPFHRQPWMRKNAALLMGGYNSYYVESDSEAGSDKFREEIGGRKIDRSKTHMIFGVRCIETTHEIPEETKVVGLQPLSDLEDDETSDGIICTDDVEEGKSLSTLIGHLLSESQSKSDESFELVEVGADPVVSIAASKLMSGGRVLVCHPDEQRLRVLEHAHMFFNERSKENQCTFQTTALPIDSSFVWLTDSSNSDRIILFTSQSLVASRLEEAIAGLSESGNPSCRVLVPSAVVSAEQLEKYEYRVVAGEQDGKNSELLEILALK